MKRMQEATSLDESFYEAHYMCASFAALLGLADIALDGAERAIRGDARYYTRCENDPCFGRVRSELEGLRARLLETQEEDFQRLLDQFRGMGVGDGVVQRWWSLPTEYERVTKQGRYAALRFAVPQASLGLSAQAELHILRARLEAVLDETSEAVPWAKRAIPTSKDSEIFCRSWNWKELNWKKVENDVATMESIESELAHARHSLPTLDVKIEEVSDRLTRAGSELRAMAERAFWRNIHDCQLTITNYVEKRSSNEQAIEQLKATMKTTSGANLGCTVFVVSFLVGFCVVAASLPVFMPIIGVSTERFGSLVLSGAFAIAVIGGIIGNRIQRNSKNRSHQLQIDELTRSISEAMKQIPIAAERLEFWAEQLRTFKAWQAKRPVPRSDL